jgi:cytochrome c peroxidase
VPRSRRGGRSCAAQTVARAALLVGCLAAATSFAHDVIPPSLRDQPVPEVPGLLSGRSRIIRDRAKAIALGKALFWDVQVGSDGMACASCHYHAGTDARLKNQVSPGRSSGATFDRTASGADGGPNAMVRAADFPFHQLMDPALFGSPVLFTTDDVVGSAGVYGGVFRAASDPASPADDCTAAPNATFHVGGAATRQVTSRNAPSMINAVFNRRSFWDGRANNVFNGVSPFGPRDPDAGVWVWRGGKLRKNRLALANAALASQAVAPPVDTSEMSCAGRTFADIGRKLLRRRPLQFQAVHPEDGVLGRHRDASGLGLRTTYAALIRRAFDRRYWAAPKSRMRRALDRPASGGDAYTQMEANFAMFFGLAVQLYESTLVSDQAPFDSDRGADGVPTALDERQRRGLTAFVALHCNECHVGPTLAGVVEPATDVDRKPVRGASGAMALGLVDSGFVNTGVAPNEQDHGVGGVDPFGRPLSFTAQYLESLQGRADGVADDGMRVRSCDMIAPFAVASFGQPAFAAAELMSDPAGAEDCSAPRWAAVPTPDVAVSELAKDSQGRLASGTASAFKVPSLRNVELTGPYMHNGGMATLEQVLEFYNRGGNFAEQGRDAQFLFGVGASPETLADIVAFLGSLTDERVRFERAPFDHPALPLPEGHEGDERGVSIDGATGRAITTVDQIPAVGASGRDQTLGPLRSFIERVQP